MNAGYPVEGMEVSIDLTRGRKGNGTYVTVDFVPVGTEQQEEEEDFGELEEETEKETKEDVVEEESKPAPAPKKASTSKLVIPKKDPDKEDKEVTPTQSLFG